jgi:hypothetical protein
MGFTTGLLIVVVLYLCHLYRTMAQKVEVLEQNCEILKDKLAPFEKDGGSLRSKVTEGGDVGVEGGDFPAQEKGSDTSGRGGESRETYERI